MVQVEYDLLDDKETFFKSYETEDEARQATIEEIIKTCENNPRLTCTNLQDFKDGRTRQALLSYANHDFNEVIEMITIK